VGITVALVAISLTGCDGAIGDGSPENGGPHPTAATSEAKAGDAGDRSAALPREWWRAMPTTSQVLSGITGTDDVDTKARQAVALDRLADVISTLGDRTPNGGWQSTSQASEQSALYKDYNRVSLAAYPKPDLYRQYQSDFEFNNGVLEKFVPVAVLDRYLATDAQRDFREKRAKYIGVRQKQQVLAQQQSDIAAQFQRRVDADKHTDVDHMVFGIPLGEKLDLPPCGDKNPWLDIIFAMSLRQGAGRTCISNYLTVATGAISAIALPKSEVSVVGAWIADGKCPSWARVSPLSCAVCLSVKNGVVLGASIQTATSDEAQATILQQLKKKYGEPRPTRKSDVSQCINEATGRVLGESTSAFLSTSAEI